MLMIVHNVSVCVERISGLWYGNSPKHKQTWLTAQELPIDKELSVLHNLGIGTQLDTTTTDGSVLATIATIHMNYSLNSLGLQQSSQLATGLP